MPIPNKRPSFTGTTLNVMFQGFSVLNYNLTSVPSNLSPMNNICHCSWLCLMFQ
jgi:hypothetical protein